MILRLFALCVALTLTPVLMPSGAAGHVGDRRHGQAAERPTSHGPIASLTESMSLRTVPLRSAHRNAWLSAPDAESRRRSSAGSVATQAAVTDRWLQQGSAAIPLRI